MAAAPRQALSSPNRAIPESPHPGSGATIAATTDGPNQAATGRSTGAFHNGDFEEGHP